MKGSVKRLKRFCKFEEYKSRKSYKKNAQITDLSINNLCIY